MEAQRAPHRELTDARNRDILAQNTPKLWAAYRRSLNRAAYFSQYYPRQEAKLLALQEAMFNTASMEGRGLDAITNAIMGAKPATIAVSATPGRTVDGVPTL